MESTTRTEIRVPASVGQVPRRGPVPLDPSLLRHVAGGVEDDAAPHGRWSLPEASGVAGDDAAPHGRW